MAYLFGPGRGNEHSDMRVVTADGALGVLDGQRLDAKQDRAEVVALGQRLDFARKAFGTEVPGGHVWHMSLALPAGEHLADEQWAEVAREAMDVLGFSGAGGKAPCRWVAVAHGKSSNENEHIHIAVTLIRGDGTRASIWNDRRKMSKFAAEIEQRFGLFVIEGRAGAGKPSLSRAELERAATSTEPEPERVRLARMVRAHASASGSEAEFARRLRGDGQLLARPRFAADRTGVVGYSVALAPTDQAKPLWFGGGRLAVDLALPRLRVRWVAGDPAEVVTAWSGRARPGREARVLSTAAWPAATAETERTLTWLRELDRGDVGAWAGAAHELAGVFATLSVRLEPAPGAFAETCDVLAALSWRRLGESRARRTRTVSALAGVAMVCRQASGVDNGTAALIVALFLCVEAVHRSRVLAARAAQADRRLADILERTAAALPPGTLGVETAASRRARAASARLAGPGRAVGGRSGPDVPPYRPPLPPPGQQRPGPDRGLGR
jgi:hypothetical protein